MNGRLYFSPHFQLAKQAPEQLESAELGQKIRGLLAHVPYEWTPPYLALPATQEPESIALAEWSDAFARLRDILQFERLLVRSSATDESLDDRGTYQTLECDCDPVAAIATIKEIRAHFKELCSRRLADVGMAIMIQPYIEALRRGHLSNERRVCKDSTTWHLETEGGVVSNLESLRFKVKKQPVARKLNVSCSTPKELNALIKQVAVWGSTLSTRVHIEWLWAKDRLYLGSATQSNRNKVGCQVPVGNRRTISRNITRSKRSFQF